MYVLHHACYDEALCEANEQFPINKHGARCLHLDYIRGKKTSVGWLLDKFVWIIMLVWNKNSFYESKEHWEVSYLHTHRKPQPPTQNNIIKSII